MEALPYYKWHWRDFRANRRVQRMGYVARGLYRELLDEFWSEGHLPNDLAELADICGCPEEEFRKHWPEIAPCWVETPNGLVNAKMDAQRTAKDVHRVKMEQAGRAGAIAKMHAAAPSKSSEFAGISEEQPAIAVEVLANAGKCHIAEHEHEHEHEQSTLARTDPPKVLALVQRDQPAERAATAAECELVYAAYPRRMGKAKALQKIRAAVVQLGSGLELPAMAKGDALAFLLRMVQAFARSPAGQQGEFTPHPATWFHQARYLDDEREWQRGNERNDQQNRHANRAQQRTDASLDALRRADAADAEAEDSAEAAGAGFGPQGTALRPRPAHVLERAR